MRKLKVYLGGPISGLSWEEAAEWRAYTTARLTEDGIACYSPLRGKEYLRDETHIGDYPSTIMSSQRGIFALNFHDVISSDLIFMNLLRAKRISIGSVMEIAWAHQAHKPIVLCIEEDNPNNHVLVREACPLIAMNLEQGIQAARQILLPYAPQNESVTISGGERPRLSL